MPNRVEEEIRRIENGPAAGERPAGVLVRVDAASEEPHAVLAKAREVILAVLRRSQGATWPAAAVWPSLLPAWFVSRCAPERTPEEAEAALARWRALPHEEKVRWEQEQPWTLLNWLYWLEPAQRHWAWWDAAAEPQQVVVRIEVQGDPFPWGALAWLLRASGATHVDRDD